MYARELMIWLHQRLAEQGTFEQTQRRFERLRGCDLLPRGRHNASVRLTNEQIANAVLGFAHPLPGFAGHASLILGDLRPVGGTPASFECASSLQSAIATLIDTGDPDSHLLRLTLSVQKDFGSEEYAATIYSRYDGETRTTSFTSKYATTLLQPGEDQNYDHERLEKLTAIQRSLGSRFFRDLSRDVSLSRQLNLPLKTDWREYDSEEDREKFHRQLGAFPSSRFLNLRVDAQVTWPTKPTRMKFGGHHLVLFPKTKDHSHSISIDLARERITADEARSLMNRLLSLMSWCDDRPSSLHEGWSGSQVPMPVARYDLGSMTMLDWHFYRTLPDNRELLRCLAYYRDGLNAYSTGLASHAVLSFFRVFETRYDTKKSVIDWVNVAFADLKLSPSNIAYRAFESDPDFEGVDLGTYVYRNCRVATAHAARDVPSDPDGTEETRRLLSASEIIRHLARYFIKQEFALSTTYLSDDPRYDD